MHTSSKRLGRAARALLLFAMLTYSGSVAVEPVVHAAVAEIAAAADAAAGPAEDAPAGEHECAVCKLTRAVTAPASQPVTFTSVEQPETAALPRNDAARAPPVLPDLQPRAPPHA